MIKKWFKKVKINNFREKDRREEGSKLRFDRKNSTIAKQTKSNRRKTKLKTLK